MYGLLSTLQAGEGGHLTPIAAPIAFLPAHTTSVPRFGLIRAGEPEFDVMQAALGRVLAESYARLARGA